MQSHRSGILFTITSIFAMAASMLIGSNIATADQVQVQSYQRASQSEACAAQPGETPWQASWGSDPSWSPSYEMWANNGTGGWVCTRSITWARTPVAAGGGSSRTYALGDIGPGGGLVFLISGGLTYEMALNTWSAGVINETTGIGWCSNTSSSIAGALGLAIGTGSSNTTAMLGFPCTSGAAFSAHAYRGGGFTDWFLPSRAELDAMYTYSRVGGFNVATYGFAAVDYWSSSESAPNSAWRQKLNDGFQGTDGKSNPLRVRPIRAF